MSTSEPLSMRRASAPVLSRALRSLAAILAKGAAHAEQHAIPAEALIRFRLFPDMLPLSSQVQIATDMAKGAVARLAGVDAPRYEDNETSFAELIDRVERVLAYIDGFTAEQLDGSEQRAIVVQLRRGDLHFTGTQYLLEFVLPNVFFHVTTAYNILRHNGVVLAKADYLGAS